MRETAGKEKRRRGTDIIVALTILFAVLKAAGIISWSWLWVVSPLWIFAGLMAVTFAVILVGGRIVKGKW